MDLSRSFDRTAKDLERALSNSTAFNAAIGAADVAVSFVRHGRTELNSRAATFDSTSIVGQAHASMAARVEAMRVDVKAAPRLVRALPEMAQTALDEAVTAAIATYGDLAGRGEAVVARVRAQQKVDDDDGLGKDSEAGDVLRGDHDDKIGMPDRIGLVEESLGADDVAGTRGLHLPTTHEHRLGLADPVDRDDPLGAAHPFVSADYRGGLNAGGIQAGGEAPLEAVDGLPALDGPAMEDDHAVCVDPAGDIEVLEPADRNDQVGQDVQVDQADRVAHGGDAGVGSSEVLLDVGGLEAEESIGQGAADAREDSEGQDDDALLDQGDH